MRVTRGWQRRGKTAAKGLLRLIAITKHNDSIIGADKQVQVRPRNEIRMRLEVQEFAVERSAA